MARRDAQQARRRAEEALGESEQRFRGAFVNAPIGMSITSIEGRWLWVNRRLCELVGYTEDELLATTFQAITHPDELEQNLRLLERAMAGELDTYRLDKRYLHKNGHEVWVSLGSSVVRDPDGRPLYVVAQMEDITERKRVEDALRESEERFRSAFDNAPIGMALTAPDGRWLRVNHRFCELVGYTEDELLGTTFQAISHQGELERTMELLNGVLAGEFDSYRLEKRYVHKDGYEVWTSVSSSIVRDARGAPLYFVTQIEDITERRFAERRLREAEERYRALVEQLPLTIYVDNLDDHISGVYVSPQIETMLGYSPEEWLSDPHFFGKVIHPDDRAAALEGNWPEGDGPHRLEYRLIARDGRAVWILDEYRIIRDADGERRYSQGYMLDITERKEAEERLRESEQYFRAVFDSAHDALAIVDDERRLVEVNHARAQLLGVTEAELIGTRMDDFAPKHLKEELERFWLAGLEQGRLTGEWEIERRDGTTRQVEYAMSFNFAPGRHLIAARDITERKVLEAQLLQSQRLEAVGRLAGGVAHDFNNLLTAIAGYGEFLLQGLQPGDPLRHDAEEIARAADRAAALVRQLLAFGRRQLLQPRKVDLNEVIVDIEPMLRRLIGEDVELVTSLDPGLAAINADPGQIEQVVVNLVVNARDAMPAGGMLTIATHNAPPGEGALDGLVGLTVQDTGVGMDDATRLRAFEPFFTTKPAGKGTGLGLSTVYGSVTQSGGRVELESEPGSGATFRILLPAVPGTAEESVPLPLPATAALGSETVLLVEDEDVVRSLAGRVLRQCGYRVLEACDATEAIAVASEHRGPIDLLLTDVVMPGLSGRELADVLTASQRDLLVLYTSGYTDDAVFQRGVSGAGTWFLPKPFTPHALALKVRELLDHAAADAAWHAGAQRRHAM